VVGGQPEVGEHHEIESDFPAVHVRLLESGPSAAGPEGGAAD
jgi:hypothetical protein